MNSDAIIALIRKHRDSFWDAQLAPPGSDMDTLEAAQRARDIADEYDRLLAEIEGTK